MLLRLTKRITAYLLLAMFVLFVPVAILIGWIMWCFDTAEAWANDAERGDL